MATGSDDIKRRPRPSWVVSMERACHVDEENIYL